jgi:hypothetical protein
MVLGLSFAVRGTVRAVEWGVAKTADRCSRRQHRRDGNEWHFRHEFLLLSQAPPKTKRL